MFDTSLLRASNTNVVTVCDITPDLIYEMTLQTTPEGKVHLQERFNSKDLITRPWLYADLNTVNEILGEQMPCPMTVFLAPLLLSSLYVASPALAKRYMRSNIEPSSGISVLDPRDLNELRAFLSTGNIHECELLNLPTFGGPKPHASNTYWSWDIKNVLMGKDVHSLDIITRQDAANILTSFHPDTLSDSIG